MPTNLPQGSLWYDGQGKPLSTSGTFQAGAQLFFYTTKTTTETNVYADGLLTTPRPQPIFAGADGRFPPIYLDPGTVYRYQLYSSTSTNSVLLEDIDPFVPPASVNAVISNLTPALIGAAFYPQSTLELANSILPTNFQYYYGDVRRYGAIGDGVTEDNFAWNAALQSGHDVLGGGSQYSYLYKAASIILPFRTNPLVIDGQGCSLKPTNPNVGSVPFFANTNATVVATTNITALATLGSCHLTPASMAGIAVGQTVAISAPNFPTYHALVMTAGPGNSITTDVACPCAYVGTITATFYANYNGPIEIKNIRFDGSGITTGNPTVVGGSFRIVQAEKVSVHDCEVFGYNTTNDVQTNAFMEVANCKQVRIANCIFRKNTPQIPIGTSTSVGIEVDDCNQALVSGIILEGSHFGINVTRCAQAAVTDSHLRGQSQSESLTTTQTWSVRGIKMTSNAVARIEDNTIEDYDSPIKLDVSFEAVIVGNVVRNQAGPVGNFTGSAMECSAGAVSNQFGILIEGNIIENSQGQGISLSNNNADPNTIVQAHIIGNRIRGCYGQAINCVGLGFLVSMNHIQDWDLQNGFGAAIGNQSVGACPGNMIVTDNFFYHTVLNTKPLLPTLTTGGIYQISGNISPTGNPVLSAGLLSNTGTSSIASGNTSVAVSHGLVKTPTADEITIYPTAATTSAPGFLWVSGISSSQFTLNCTTNPGASGLAFTWKAQLKQPFTR